mgnify:CR=1 FL=1
MTTVAMRIYHRLDIDPKQPTAEADALQRLSILNVHGKTCTRCKGSGHYPARADQGAICFGCQGRGANGIALTQKALDQLNALEERGVLTTYRNRWRVGAILKQARKELNQMIEDSGVEQGYVQYNAHLKPKGNWNRDHHDFHQAMREAAQVINRFPSVREFESLTALEQDAIREQLVGDVAGARQRIAELTVALIEYRMNHPKPDFRALCRQLAGLEPGGTHATV